MDVGHITISVRKYKLDNIGHLKFLVSKKSLFIRLLLVLIMTQIQIYGVLHVQSLKC